MTWHKKPVGGGAKSSETQFNYLMQLLLHHRAEGISRSHLEQALFGDRDIADIHHAARSVIYNAKKKLKAAGLPPVNYVENKSGIYRWTQEIPVQEDAAEMDRLFREAQKETSPKQALSLYLEACHCYTGEFLGAQTAVWAAQEARRYRALFCTCVDEAARLLRESHNYPQMEELGLYAAQVSLWQTGRQ